MNISRLKKKIIICMLGVFFASQIPARAASLTNVSDGTKISQSENNSVLNAENSKKNLDFEVHKQNWEEQVNSARVLQILGLAVGGAGLIGGTVLIYDGDNQRTNAEFVQKGNYITNEDDVNAGNAKVLTGGLIFLGATGLLVLGALQGARLGPLEREGRRKGFIISTKENNRVVLQYAWNF